jgi:hypothetical protein
MERRGELNVYHSSRDVPQVFARKSVQYAAQNAGEEEKWGMTAP